MQFKIILIKQEKVGRIFGIDYGKKRVGIAVSDPLKMIANGIDTVATAEIFNYIKEYLSREKVERFVVGLPKQMNNTYSESVIYIVPFVNKLKKTYPEIPVEYVDERFTSKIAKQTMLAGGLKKKARQNKALVDKISATIILQSYLDFN